jgi:putative addiction module CopG family antidote
MMTMNITLPETLITFIDQEVSRGEYLSQSEVVRHALSLLHRAKTVEREDFKPSRSPLTAGILMRSVDKLSDDFDREDYT